MLERLRQLGGGGGVFGQKTILIDLDDSYK